MTCFGGFNRSTVKHMVSCEFIIESESYLLIIKHGLLENPPFSWMIFPCQCPFYRGFPRSPTPFLDVLRQLPGRKAVAAAILFRCAGHAGGHVVLPTGRSQRVPKKSQNKYIRNMWWLPRKARSAWVCNLTRIANCSRPGLVKRPMLCCFSCNQWVCVCVCL